MGREKSGNNHGASLTRRNKVIWGWDKGENVRGRSTLGEVINENPWVQRRHDAVYVNMLSHRYMRTGVSSH